MGEPPDVVDDRRCRATAKQTGKRCRRFPVPGGFVCIFHGGASPQAREAAKRRRAEAEAIAVLEGVWDPSASPIANPVEALAALAGKAEHALDVLGARVTIGELEGAAGVAWLRVMRELRQMLEGLERLDLAGKSLALDQERADLIVNAFRVAVASAQLLPVDQARILGVYLEQLDRVLPGEVATVGAFAVAAERIYPAAGEQLASVVRAVLDRLDLTAEQWAVAERVVPEEFRRSGVVEGQVVRGELG